MNEAAGNTSPTERFSDRVPFYDRYRPRYPEAIVPFLEKATGLARNSLIADVGTGTGLLAQPFVSAGYKVFGVEPNDDMRAVAEARFKQIANFISVAARAEMTTLPSKQIDLITVGQAFHWFDLDETRTEFERILKADGWLALVYNSWNVPHSPVAGAYRRLVERYGIDYQRVKHQNRMDEDLAAFFGGEGPRKEQFANDQSYDFDALRGRVLSSSYAPLPAHPHFEPLIAGLREMYEEYAVDGRLLFPYVTTVYFGKLL